MKENGMRLATMVGHDPKCGGCPACSEEMARVLTMTPAEYSRWLRARVQPLLGRTAQCTGATVPRQDSVPEPPDLVARIRAAAKPAPAIAARNTLRQLLLAGISYDHMK